MHAPLQRSQESEHYELTQAEVVWLVDVAEVVVQKRAPRALRQAPRTQAALQLPAHLCGDQHLAVSVRHGIDTFDDGPYAFTSPALINTIYPITILVN